MGRQDISAKSTSEQLRLFEKRLLGDVQALEQMLTDDLLESGVSRIGAEQELFIVDKSQRPYPKSLKILAKLDDHRFTTELGSFNLEFNLDPLSFEGNCFQTLEQDLNDFIERARTAASQFSGEIILTGILPSLSKSDLGLKNMTPMPRYFALNDAITRLRGSDYDMYLRGIDQLYIKHDSVMLEACNTSFQVHFQVDPQDFAKYYNIAQAVAGPVLAASGNSPLLFGKRLWHETRIAVFQHSTDTRNWPSHLRQSMPRVTFGRDWIKESILEIFKEDISRYRVLLATEVEEDSVKKLKEGKIPRLKALQLHNSSVYRWTRPCYGITNGIPHLRIENRLFPSGPTTLDEVANTAFWLGLVNGLARKYSDIRELLDFDDVKANFYAAARRGLKAQFKWIDDETIPAQSLLNNLLPVAAKGLHDAGIDKKDAAKYLGIVEKRIDSGQTGSQWILNSYTELRKKHPDGECMPTLVRATIRHQKKGGRPVHEWPTAKTVTNRKKLASHYLEVRQIMSTDLFTVSQEDTIDLVLNVMKWQDIRHLPVEGINNRLEGIVDYRSLVKLLSSENRDQDLGLLPVSAIIQTEIPSVSPETKTLDAITLMLENGLSCLPVVSEERLVGIITEHDFIRLTAQFLQSRLGKVGPEVESKEMSAQNK